MPCTWASSASSSGTPRNAQKKNSSAPVKGPPSASVVSAAAPSIATMEKIKQRFGAAAAKAFGVPALDFSSMLAKQEGVGPASTPLSSARSLGDFSSFRPSRLAPGQAKFDKQDLAQIIRQVGAAVGAAVAVFCQREIERIPGWMRKRMAGEQCSQCDRSRTEEVKSAIALWLAQPGAPQDWIDRAFSSSIGTAAAGQEMYAPILNPLPEPHTGVSYPQLRARELADHLFGSGHFSMAKSAGLTTPTSLPGCRPTRSNGLMTLLIRSTRWSRWWILPKSSAASTSSASYPLRHGQFPASGWPTWACRPSCRKSARRRSIPIFVCRCCATFAHTLRPCGSSPLWTLAVGCSWRS